jgi:hypothetical protein
VTSSREKGRTSDRIVLMRFRHQRGSHDDLNLILLQFKVFKPAQFWSLHDNISQHPQPQILLSKHTSSETLLRLPKMQLIKISLLVAAFASFAFATPVVGSSGVEPGTLFQPI